jgi:mannose-6-phosphate isomerase-like protein (cupin superfamily)
MKIISLPELPEEPVSHNPAIRKRVMLRAGELPHLTNFSQSRFSPGRIAPAHRHEDMCEVFLVQSGTGVIRIDGIAHPLRPGTCVAVDLGEDHEIENTGSEDLVLTYFGLKVRPEDL